MLHYYLHIPKCGGETIKQYYFKIFGRENCVKVWNPAFGADCHPKEFATVDISRANCIIGHLYFLDALKNGAFKLKFDNEEILIHTIVRDPIDRMISLYNFISNLERHPLHEEIRAQNIVCFLLEQPKNNQCKMLGIDFFGSVEGILERIQVIDLERSNTYFYNYFNNNFNTTIPQMSKANVTAEKFKSRNQISKDDIPNDIITLLKKRNELDYKLYELAKSKTR